MVTTIDGHMPKHQQILGKQGDATSDVKPIFGSPTHTISKTATDPDSADFVTNMTSNQKQANELLINC